MNNYTYSPYRNQFRMESRMNSGQTTEASKSEVKVLQLDISPMMVVWGLAVISVLLGMAFLFSYNKVATKGYYLKRLEIANQELIYQKQQIDMQLSQAKSMTAMLEEGRMEGMRLPKETAYFSPAEHYLASNQPSL